MYGHEANRDIIFDLASLAAPKLRDKDAKQTLFLMAEAAILLAQQMDSSLSRDKAIEKLTRIMWLPEEIVD